MGRVGRNREVGVVEWKVKDVSQVKLGVVTQPGADVSRRLFALGDPEFAAVQTICLLAGPVGHADKQQACFVNLSRNNEPGAWLDRKSTRLNSSHIPLSRMPSSA